ncbi:hypothetical protein BJV82DRAFT_669648 [Fennellomyces sp. T-0311]|nr:hypothetical protein BJV82DRAFT_669648 [Fennellomyces sp. T-0311]
MNTVQSETNNNEDCLVKAGILGRVYQTWVEDILTDDDLLDLLRIMKQNLRKKPDIDRVAKLFFCISNALRDTIEFCKPMHDDRILFRNLNHQLGTVVLPSGARVHAVQRMIFRACRISSLPYLDEFICFYHR